jgi:hypothetical protein
MSRTFVLTSVFLALMSGTCAARCPQEPTASSPRPQEPPAPAQNSTKPKPKKVWTNENLSESGGTISVVGDTRNASKTPSKSAPVDKSIDPRILANLRQQLQKLQAQLAAVDQQLSNLKDFGKGEAKNAGGLQPNTWQYNSSSVDEQIRNLQGTKSKIQASIDTLFDAARKSGIEPGQLR